MTEDILAIIATFGTGVFVVYTGARVYLKKLELQHHGDKSPLLHSAIEQRLERIEQAVDAIAVEMERVSEGQRFTTKLLAERAPQSAHTDLPSSQTLR
ncbi:MAG: hypothetical protein JWN53_192 [Gemmatimonadetes bacterium]|jgi:hypothetical protein|nr:hypothetical protein [Gemmatimonadota bacterium]